MVLVVAAISHISPFRQCAGAGDNFITGVVYGLIHDLPLEKCLRLGNVFAGKSITAVGCFGATVTREEISQSL